MTPTQSIDMLDETEERVVGCMAKARGVEELEMRRRISASPQTCHEYTDRIFLDLRMRVASGVISPSDTKVYR